jgi:sensor domain CHASE-containing protein
MTAQKKLWFFFLLLFCLFSVGIVLSLRLEHTHLLKLQQSEIQARKSSFENVLKLNQQAIFVLARDYSYWDELVTAIKNEDKAWAKVNIDSGIKTYEADGAWVYNMDFKWIYSVNKFSDDRLMTLPLDAAQIKQIFGRQTLVHFFIETPVGYLELEGATVHPSNDSDRKTLPQGYIFAGKLWNRDYLKMLSGLAGCGISVLPFQSPRVSLLPQERFLIDLNDWQGKALFTIIGDVKPDGINSFVKYSRLLLKMFLLYTVLQMLFLLYFLRRFFREPQVKQVEGKT